MICTVLYDVMRDHHVCIFHSLSSDSCPCPFDMLSLGALVGITSVLLVTLMSQPRILLAIARDGLLPPSFFAAIHPTYGTPYKATILTGALVSFVSSLIPLR